jgi:hypothetical protein
MILLNHGVWKRLDFVYNYSIAVLRAMQNFKQAKDRETQTDRNFVICTFQMIETKFRKGAYSSINWQLLS